MNRYHNGGMYSRSAFRGGTAGQPGSCSADQITKPAYGSCGNTDAGGDPAGMPLAIAFVKDQEFTELYTCGEAISRGTLFRELDKPFIQGRRVD